MSEMDDGLEMALQMGLIVQIPLEIPLFPEDAKVLVRDLGEMVDKGYRIETCRDCPGCALWVGHPSTPRWLEWEAVNAE